LPLDRWVEELSSRIDGPERSGRAREFAVRAPANYPQENSPRQAARDLAELDALDSGAPGGSGRTGRLGGPHRLVVTAGSGESAGSVRLRRYGHDSVELSAVLPIVESFGLVVVEAVPYRFAPSGDRSRAADIDEFRLRTAGIADESLAGAGPVPLRQEGVDGSRLVEALEAVARGAADVDSLNRLVTGAGLHWWQVAVLRAYRRYRRQLGAPWSDAELDGPLVGFPEVAISLVDYFERRFDPEVKDRPDAVSAARDAVLAALGDVAHLRDDQVLRGYLQLVEATMRTNYFLIGPGPAGRATGPTGEGDDPGEPPSGPPRALVLKLAPGSVEEVPAPRPLIEAFVHGPTVEATHVRAGLVARGGIRWSDRPEDFRTEVVDLAFSQVKKNAIIVPTGAKGGFVCRHRPNPTPGDIRAAYETFIAALLDVTDDYQAGEVVHPDGVVSLDGPDPYLVVAADRGTAALSDVANALSIGRRFWLGDAFAAGGSHGYDHKAMGITARGAWVAVRSHFHQLGIDVQVEPIRVVGVGDMSGDVFGNGMLQSPAIRLVAAFDHRHVFVDPDPDPAASWAERRRLARLDRSSWDDYERGLLSPGGGVWARDLKRIPLAPEARRSLGVSAEELSPPELISAILRAPVDLLWFGGVGTFVKAVDEADSEVADHANDGVRITADQVRARVIAEGGNLGITQRARIRYSRRGGRINTDFIDNAAGVATSDREVNLKILAALAIEAGRVAPGKRDALLHSVEGDVADAVVHQVAQSVAALTRAVPASAVELDAYAALLDHLVADGRLDREAESLPGAEELAVRRGAGAGWIRPELAVLLAYAKSDLVVAIEGSPLARDPVVLPAVRSYFPPAMRELGDDLIPRHRLAPELAATELAGQIVNQMGIVWAYETSAETGRSIVEVAAAFWAAQEVVGAAALWSSLGEAAERLDADSEAGLHAEVVSAVRAVARSYLVAPGPVDATARIAADQPIARQLETVPPRSPGGLERAAYEGVAPDVAPELSARWASIGLLSRVGEVAPVVRATGWPAEEVVPVIEGVEATSGLDRLHAAVQTAPPPSRWAAWQSRLLLDDTSALVCGSAVEAIGLVGPDRSPERALARWQDRRREAIRRALALIAQLDPARPDVLSVAALAVKALRLPEAT
jgi:glutamate dehydrogenase